LCAASYHPNPLDFPATEDNLSVGNAAFGDDSLKLQTVWPAVLSRFPYLGPAAPLKDEHLYGFYDQLFIHCRPVLNALELGVHNGGSVILWREALGCRIAGVDLEPAPDTTPLLESYLRETASEDDVRFVWGTSQSNERVLRRLVDEHFAGSLQMVVDDASHLYAPTRKSFEVLFPLLEPGGAYFIEDWAAGTRADFDEGQGPVDRFVRELVEDFRDRRWPIDALHITPGVALVLKTIQTLPPGVPRRQIDRDALPFDAYTNLLRNGNFAIGFARAAPGGWILRPDPTTACSLETDELSKRRVARLSKRRAADPLLRYGAISQPVPRILAGRRYVIAVDYRYSFESAPDDSRSVGIVAYCLDAQENVLPGGTFVNWGWDASGSWQRKTMSIVPPAGSAILHVEFRISVNGDLWLTDAQLQAEATAE
jgi:hypothetical protein